MENEYTKQATDFLKRAGANIKIEFQGVAINKNWDNKKRNLYKVTLTTPRGAYTFDFWDSINNTKICAMSIKQYAEKRYKIRYDDLDIQEKNVMEKELKDKKDKARPCAYDVLSVMTKYDPGTFEDFCCEFGYNTDSRKAEAIYFSVQKEYNNLVRIFTEKQMEELAEIQ